MLAQFFLENEWFLILKRVRGVFDGAAGIDMSGYEAVLVQVKF